MEARNATNLGPELAEVLLQVTRERLGDHFEVDMELMQTHMIHNNQLLAMAERGAAICKAQDYDFNGWFADCRELAGCGSYVECAIFAVLSADCDLSQNVAMFQSWVGNDFKKGAVRFPYQAETIRNLLAVTDRGHGTLTIDLADTMIQKASLKGGGRLSKTQRFFYNLVDEREYATVDLWILRAFGNLPEELFTRVFQHSSIYSMFTEEVEAQAKLQDMDAATFQTLVWIGSRGEIF